MSAFYRERLGIEAVGVSKPVFVDGGPAIREEMLSLIRHAEREILVTSFLLNDGPETRPILEALAEKAASGVRVHLMGDGSSRYVKEPEAFDFLTSRGVSWAEFHPVRGWRILAPRMVFERDHRKFWVIDGRTVFLGGANLSDASLLDPERGGNRDLMVRIESPEVARLLSRSFARTWNEGTGAEKLGDSPLGTDGGTAEDSPVKFWLFDQEETRSRESMTGVMMEGLFASAKRSIWLVQPYTFTNSEILSGIESMTRRGVEVNLVLSTQARAPRFRYASYYGIRDLLEAGARVWIYDSKVSPLHYKCALVDDRLAFVGSANLNYRSYHLSRELNVVFDDPRCVREVKQVVDSVRKDCREVKMEEAVRYRSLPFATWWIIMQTAG